MENSALTVRFAAADEAAACNDLHNRLYQEERTIEQWRWEFVSTIFQHPQIPFSVVDDGGTIVGTQAFIPIRMINRDGVFWTAKSEETLLDPAYRGKRLLGQMYDCLFEYAAEHGLRYVWGFTPADKALRRVGFDIPTRTSQLIIPFYCRDLPVLLQRAGINKPAGVRDRIRLAGFKIGCVAARLASAARFARAERVTRRVSTSHALRLQVLEQPPEQSDALCRRFVSQWGGTTIFRDADYLRWRIFENPYVRPIMCAAYDGEELLGWAIYSMGDDGAGYLVDVLVVTEPNRPYTPEDVVRRLLVQAVRSIRNMGAIAIRGWHVNDHPFAELVMRVARSVGFHHVRRGQSVVVRAADPQATSMSQNFAEWYVTRIFMEGTVG